MGIEGKIANILNTRELVINRGSDDGVANDMEFAIMEPRLGIVDPETQEPLGELEREKIRVRIFETHPKFSLARTYETYRALDRDRGLLGGLGSQSSYVTQVKRLNTTGAPAYQEGVANVNVGDVATQIPSPVSNVSKKDIE